jgi:hypothetical protein
MISNVVDAHSGLRGFPMLKEIEISNVVTNMTKGITEQQLRNLIDSYGTIANYQYGVVENARDNGDTETVAQLEPMFQMNSRIMSALSERLDWIVQTREFDEFLSQMEVDLQTV